MSDNIETVKRIAIALGQFENLRRAYRVVNRRNRREALGISRFVESLSLKDRLVFDIGANIGTMSEAFLDHGARVVAIEPNIALLPELRARCSNSPRLTILPIAISAAADIRKFFIPEWSGQSSLHEDWSNSPTPPTVTFVPCLPFSALVEAFGRPYYVKIDVEGHEFAVVEGIRELVPLISFEFHMDPVRAQEAVRVTKTYGALGNCEANVLLEGAEAMYFPEWLPPTKFSSSFLELCSREQARASAFGHVFLRSLSAGG